MLKESELDKIQKKLGYQFENKKLLQQAFTRKSFAACNGGVDNETLEFYGDRILNLAVIKDFCDKHGKFNNKGDFISSKSVGELDRENRNLVKNVHLAEQITHLGLSKYLQVDKFFEKSIMKVKADLFEAILGAVALDSNWNIQKISDVFHSMMYPLEGVKEQTFNPEEYIDLFETELWKQSIFKTENTYVKIETGYKCSVLLGLNGNFIKIHGYGNTEHVAKIKASERGYIILLIIVEGKFFDLMGYSEQLYLLYSCGVISEPRFHFEFYPSDSGNKTEFWRCFGGLCDSDTEFESEAATQYDAKETVSHAILCDKFGIAAENLELSRQEPPVLHVAVNQSNASSDTSSANVSGQGLLKIILSRYAKTA